MAIDFHRSDHEPSGRADPPGSPELGSDAPDNASLTEAEQFSPEFSGAVNEQRRSTDRSDSRIARWQRKLLDLSLHNRLLNYKPTRRSLALLSADPAALTAHLESGARMKIVPLPRPAGQEGADSGPVEPGPGAKDANRRLAAEALQRGEVIVDLERTDLAARLVQLYRTARADIQEGGANTLYLVIGFLKWKREDRGERKFRAPLILIPATLQRQSVRAGVRLTLHEDEPRFNTTLLEMLRQDFALSISGLDDELTSNGDGIEVAGVLERLRSELDGVDGFEITEDVVLGTFSFAKYLMWRDLVDRTGRITDNRLVRHLTEPLGQPRQDQGEFPQPALLDREYPPDSLYTVLPADSSQLSAVAACAKQKDFVLIGPPGTGKSQTIANMIAHTLAEGRTVLFVSEKVAALEVVFRRLQQAGLGEFCLELHSNKARKVEVLEQLRDAWSLGAPSEAGTWRREARRLKDLRDALNVYVERVHRRFPNGLTPFLAMGQVVGDLDQSWVSLSWTSADAHDEAALNGLRDVAARMDIYATASGRVSDSGFELVRQTQWSPEWQKAFVAAAHRVVDAASQVRERTAAMFGALRIKPRTLTLDCLRALKLLAIALPQARGRDLRFALERGALSTIAQLEDGLALLDQYPKLKRRLDRSYSEPDTQDEEMSTRPERWQDARSSWWPQSESVRRRIRNAMMASGSVSGKPEYGRDLKLLWELKEVESKISRLDSLKNKVTAWRGLDTEPGRLERDLLHARRILYAVSGLGNDTQSLLEAHAAVRDLVVGRNELLEARSAVGAICAALAVKLQALETVLEEFSALAGANAYECIRAASGGDWLEAASDAASGLIKREAQLNAWCAWRRVRDEAVAAGLGPLVAAVERGDVAPGGIQRCFENSYCRWWVSDVVENDPVLGSFHSAERDRRIQNFRELDRQFIELTRQTIRARLCAGLPPQDQIEEAPEFGVLKRELEKKTRHKPLRRLISEIPTALTRLTPCLLMSPLSVAQYLAPDQEVFDLVIFDEASQITVWDAVGAIARGRQTIVVGDPKQLPPTSFFSRSDDEPDEDEDVEGDLESILEECLGAGLSARSLEWHYRSEHESLIAFSNHRYYDGNLITFPSPVTFDRAVRRVHVADGVYGRGGTRTNRAEAKAVVAEVVNRLISPSFTDSNRSIGVVTFNVEQQRLIEDLLDEERAREPSIERYFSEDQLEPLFVKNLESVQGDERDLILFSVTFGPDADGHISMNFGPLNRDGGERRLNVAITRARRELIVFSTLRSEQIDLSRAAGAGVTDFKHFLEFTERGSRALAESIYGSVGEYGSLFESAVARSLSERGWVVHPQIGVSDYRISLGIVHPDSPGRYLAGLECDGETYRRSPTARDRDKLREEVLAKIGWNIVRTWSMDWWLDEERAAEKLDRCLTELLERARSEAEAERLALLHVSLLGSTAEDHDSSTGSLFDRSEKNQVEGVQSAQNSPRGAADGEPIVSSTYCVSNPPEAGGDFDQERFFDRSQDDAIRRTIDYVVAAEGPLRDDVLVKRVVRVYGFKRTGKKLRDRVLDLTTSRYETTSDAGGVFFWPVDTSPERWNTFRAPVSEEDFRSANEICFEELAVLARHILDTRSEDPAREMALKMGLTRIDSGTRRRLEDVLSQVEARPSVDDSE